MSILIITKKPKHVETQEVDYDYTKNKDWEYMKHCNEVDENRPATWTKYPATITGANDIIKMEFDIVSYRFIRQVIQRMIV